MEQELALEFVSLSQSMQNPVTTGQFVARDCISSLWEVLYWSYGSLITVTDASVSLFRRDKICLWSGVPDTRHLCLLGLSGNLVHLMACHMASEAIPVVASPTLYCTTKWFTLLQHHEPHILVSINHWCTLEIWDKWSNFIRLNVLFEKVTFPTRSIPRVIHYLQVQQSDLKLAIPTFYTAFCIIWICHSIPCYPSDDLTWWRHQMEPLSALLALCVGISPVPVNSPHKGQWRGALMFSLICAWINDWVNNREAGDLKRHRGHNDVSVMNMWGTVHKGVTFCNKKLNNCFRVINKDMIRSMTT